MNITQSKYSAEETVINLENFLNEKGIKIFAKIDHASVAVDAGLDLPFTQVIVFGDPKVGTLLMQVDRRLAIDLPLKILVWEEDSVCKVGYHSLADIVANLGYDLGEKVQIVNKIDGLMDLIINNISGS
jgi:uncharacterized protein (DUF302 family)